MESAEKQSQDWACCLALSCVVCSAFCWLESSTHFSGCSICSILGEPSISGQHCSRVPYRHICHQQSVRTYAQASYLTALGKQGFGKKQQLCWAREGEAAQWPASSLDGWLGPEALNTWINWHLGSPGTSEEVTEPFCAWKGYYVWGKQLFKHERTMDLG